MSTQARVREVDGNRVAEHKHDGYGWHWASAGHRDDGKIHLDAKAKTPEFSEGMTDADKELYRKSVEREIINKIPSKAKPKEMAEPAPTPEPAAKAEPRQRANAGTAANR